MRVVLTSKLVPGMILRKPIYELGKIVVNANVPLTEMAIKLLHKLDLPYVYVHAPFEEESVISRELRIEITKKIEVAFEKELENSTPNLKIVIASLLKEVKHNNTVLSLLTDLVLYDEYLFKHSLNVALYSLEISINLGLNKSEQVLLGLGALLHDVGKIAIPKMIINKQGRLTEDEYEFIKQHTIAGYEILKEIHNIHSIVAECALQHHERIDGSGYPLGRCGKNIHLYSKIIAIADFYDAVTTNRVYRQAMLTCEGLELLNSGSNTLFDAKLIKIFNETHSQKS